MKYFAFVTVNVETLVHCYYSNRFFLAWLWGYRQMANVSLGKISRQSVSFVFVSLFTAMTETIYQYSS